MLISKNPILKTRKDFLMNVFNFSNTKLIDRFVCSVVKSNKFTLLAETLANDSMTYDELLTLRYRLKLEFFLIPQQ